MAVFRHLCLVTLLALGWANEDSFMFVALPKSPLHPFFNEGSDIGFSVRSPAGVVIPDSFEMETEYFVEGAEILLRRGKPYKFDLSKVSSEFEMHLSVSLLSLSEIYREGVSDLPSNLEAASSFLFTPTSTCPSVLFYGSLSREYMGGVIRLVDGLQDNEPTRSKQLIPVTATKGTAEAQLQSRVSRNAPAVSNVWIDSLPSTWGLFASIFRK